MIIGIEGPAGSGKTTMARTVAAELGATVIEGGAWYRALTLRALKQKVGPDDTKQLVELANNLDLELEAQPDGTTRYLFDGHDVTEEMYQETVSVSVAHIAQKLKVRAVITPKFAGAVRAQGMAIVVGRHLKRIFPEASILRLAIDAKEADRRHYKRAGEAAQSVAERNSMDKITGKLLDPTTNHDAAAIDVSSLDQNQQADVLRMFIQNASAA